MHSGRAGGADRGEEILRFQGMRDVVELLAVAGEEDGARTWSIADAYDIATDVGRCVGRWYKGLIESAVASRGVGNRGFMVACRVTCQRERARWGGRSLGLPGILNSG